jgi:hypothetical protein
LKIPSKSVTNDSTKLTNALPMVSMAVTIVDPIDASNDTTFVTIVVTNVANDVIKT